jgi:protein ImuA
MYAEKSLLLDLRERVRRIERPAAAMHGVLPLGVATIDRALPGGGLARGALHEILGAGGDEEDSALAAAFTARILGRLILPTSPSRPPPIPSPACGGGVGWEQAVRGEVGVILWCLARPDLYGPGLAAHGLDPGRIVLVRAPRDGEILWAMEEGLRASGILAVVGEVGSLPAVASRRLQLAAERSGITAFLLRRWRDGGQAARERALPNAAITRWRITALPSRTAPGVPGIGRPRWRVELLRCRGGEPASWEMEVPDATDPISLATALADRPAAPVTPERLRRAG